MGNVELEGQAQRLCVYIGESDSWHGQPLYAAILESLKVHGLAGATVVRGVAGFGAHSRAIHTAAILRLSQDLPLRIEVVDTQEHIARALDLIEPMVGEGMITLEAVQVVRYTHRYLNPLPADRPVSEVMTRDVASANTTMTAAEAWHLMLRRNVKTLPVVDAQGKVVGMLTDDDLLERAGLRQRLSVARQLDSALIEEELAALERSPQRVAQIMSQPAIVIRDDESLGHAARQMTRHGVKRLPVVDAEGRLKGVLSRVDVLCQVANSKPGRRLDRPSPPVGRTLGEVMSPVVPMVYRDDDLQAVIAAFVATGSHRLIVTEEGGRAIGLVSDADVIGKLPTTHHRGLLSALRGTGTAPQLTLRAQDLMSEGVLSASPDTTIIEALRLMLPQERKWIVVVDDAGKPLGLADRAILLASITPGADLSASI